ncbi:hypothetical protein DSECCO2_622710 [anaerobic digester metagenome]
MWRVEQRRSLLGGQCDAAQKAGCAASSGCSGERRPGTQQPSPARFRYHLPVSGRAKRTDAEPYQRTEGKTQAVLCQIRTPSRPRHLRDSGHRQHLRGCNPGQSSRPRRRGHHCGDPFHRAVLAGLRTLWRYNCWFWRHLCHAGKLPHHAQCPG